MSEALSLAAFWKDAPNADRQERQWLSGQSISAQDLLHGSARIERCNAAEWWRGALGSAAGNRGGGAGPVAGAGSAGGGASPIRQKDRQSSGQAAAQVPRDQGVIRGRETGKAARGGLLMSFGRHRGRLAADVREDDPGYWRWATGPDGPSWFRKAAAKAGLLDEEDES